MSVRMLPQGVPGRRLEVQPWLVVQSLGWGAAAPEPFVLVLCPASCCTLQKLPELQKRLLRPHTAWSLSSGPRSWFHCWCSLCPTVWTAASWLWMVEVQPSNGSIRRGPVHGREWTKPQCIIKGLFWICIFSFSYTSLLFFMPANQTLCSFSFSCFLFSSLLHKNYTNCSRCTQHSPSWWLGGSAVAVCQALLATKTHMNPQQTASASCLPPRCQTLGH